MQSYGKIWVHFNGDIYFWWSILFWIHHKTVNNCKTYTCFFPFYVCFWLQFLSLQEPPDYYLVLKIKAMGCGAETCKAFQNKLCVPFPVSNWKTHTIFSMEKGYFSAYDEWTYCCWHIRYEKCSISKEKFCEIWKLMHLFLKNVCVFFLCVCFFASLAPSFLKKSWVKTHNLFWMA